MAARDLQSINQELERIRLRIARLKAERRLAILCDRERKQRQEPRVVANG